MKVKKPTNEIEEVQVLITLYRTLDSKKGIQRSDSEIFDHIKHITYKWKNMNNGRRKNLTSVEKREISLLSLLVKKIFNKEISPSTLLNRLKLYEDREIRHLYLKMYPHLTFSNTIKILNNRELREKVLELYHNGKSIMEIVDTIDMFKYRDVNASISSIEGLNKALRHLFSIGKYLNEKDINNLMKDIDKLIEKYDKLASR